MIINCLLSLRQFTFPAQRKVEEVRRDSDMDTSEYGPEHKAYEEFVVLQPYTVPSPWTMVIHSHNAFPTNAAVMSARRSDTSALMTKSESSKILDRLINIDLIEIVF
jgi:hypothetical protein